MYETNSIKWINLKSGLLNKCGAKRRIYLLASLSNGMGAVGKI